MAETRIVFYTVGCSVRNPGKRSIIFYFSTSIFYSSFHSIFPIFPCIFTCGRQLVNRRSTSSTANFSSHDDLFFRRQREQRPSIPNLNGQNQSPPFASPLHVFCSVSRLCCRSFSLRILRVFHFVCLSPLLQLSVYTTRISPPPSPSPVSFQSFAFLRSMPQGHSGHCNSASVRRVFARPVHHGQR